MELGNEYKFHVIEFLQLPYKKVDEYVCVPRSWIRMRRKTDRKISVVYPIEKPSRTQWRVRMRQKFSRKWKLYRAIVKYDTNSYYDAEKYIAAKNNTVSTDSGISDMENKGNILLSAMQTCSPQENAQSNPEINKSPLIVMPLKKPSNLTIRLLKRRLQMDPRQEDFKRQLELHKFADGTPSISSYFESVSKKQSTTDIQYSDQKSPVRESCVQKSNEDIYIDGENYPHSFSKITSYALQNSPNTVKLLGEQFPTVHELNYDQEPCSQKIIVPILNKMNSINQRSYSQNSIKNTTSTMRNSKTFANVEKFSSVDQNHSEQESYKQGKHVGKSIDLRTIDQITNSQSYKKNTKHWMHDSTNLENQFLLCDSHYYNQYLHTKELLLAGSTKVYDDNQRLCPRSNTDQNISNIPNSTNLADNHNQWPHNHSDENQILLDHADCLRRELQTLERLPRKLYEMRDFHQSTCPQGQSRTPLFSSGHPMTDMMTCTQSNKKNTTSACEAMRNSRNFANKEQCSPVHRQNHPDQQTYTPENLVGTTFDLSGTDDRDLSESNMKNKKSWMHNSQNLENLSAKHSHDNTVLLSCVDYYNQDMHTKEMILGRTIKANGDVQRVCPQSNIPENTTSSMRNIRNSNQSSMLFKPSYNKVYVTANRAKLYQEQCDEATHFGRLTEDSIFDQRSPQSITKNIPFTRENSSNIVNQCCSSYQCSHTIPFPSCPENFSFPDLLKQKIPLARCTRVNDIDRRACPQSNTNKTVRNATSLANHSFKLSRYLHEKQFLPVLNKNLLYGSSTQKNIDRKTTGGNHMERKSYLQGNTKNTTYALQNSSNLDQSCMLSERFYEMDLPQSCVDYSQQDPHMQNMSERSTETYYNGQEPDLENITLSTSSAAQKISNIAIQGSQTSGCSDNKQNSLTIKNHFKQPKPGTPILFVGKSIGANGIDQRARLQSVTKNTSSSIEDSPNFLASHLCQLSEHSHENRCENYLSLEPHTQEILVRKPSGSNRIEQSACFGSHVKDRASVIQISTNNPRIENQLCSSFDCSMQERFSPTYESCSDQNSYIHEIHDIKCIDTNRIRPCTHFKNNTESKLMERQTSTNAVNKSENRVTTIDKVLLDKFNILFQKIETTVSDTHALLEHVQDTLLKYADTFRRAMKLLNNQCESKNNNGIESTSKLTTAEFKNITDEKHNSEEKREKLNYDGDDDDDDDSNGHSDNN